MDPMQPLLIDNFFSDAFGAHLDYLDVRERMQLRVTNTHWKNKVDNDWGNVKVQISLPDEIKCEILEDVKILFCNMQSALSRSHYFSKVKLPITIASAKCLYQYLSMRAKASLFEKIAQKTGIPRSCISAVKQKAYNVWKYKDRNEENMTKAIFSMDWQKSAVIIDQKLTQCVSDQDVVERVTELDIPRKSMFILPAQILQLKNLTSLNLFHNDLLFFPNRLTHLQQLTLKNNPALPEELCEKVQHNLAEFTSSELKGENRNDLYDLDTDDDESYSL